MWVILRGQLFASWMNQNWALKMASNNKNNIRDQKKERSRLFQNEMTLQPSEVLFLIGGWMPSWISTRSSPDWSISSPGLSQPLTLSLFSTRGEWSVGFKVFQSYVSIWHFPALLPIQWGYAKIVPCRVLRVGTAISPEITRSLVQFFILTRNSTSFLFSRKGWSLFFI